MCLREMVKAIFSTCASFIKVRDKNVSNSASQPYVALKGDDSPELVTPHPRPDVCCTLSDNHAFVLPNLWTLHYPV